VDLQQLENTFQRFNDLTVLVIGDVMIDAYIWGDVSRISPEAPVPIIDIQKRENRLGGAANVAINVKALDAKPIICSVIGNDEKGVLFNQLLTQQGLSTEGIVNSGNRKTTVKTRIISNNQQMLRVDDEITSDLNKSDEDLFISNLLQIINNQKIDVIIFEDYNKGTITPKVIREVILVANEKNIPTTVDPKYNNFFEYKNCTLFKPNLKELKDGLKLDINAGDLVGVSSGILKLKEKLDHKITLITLSEHGVLIKSDVKETHIPAHIRNISDVSGAGDTVISVASLCLALNLNPKEIAELSNLSGGLVCEEVGVVPINKKRFFNEAKLLIQ